MSDTYRDWIPEGEDTGAIGEGGYQDFVPAPEPKPQVVEPTVPPLEPKAETNQEIKDKAQGGQHDA